LGELLPELETLAPSRLGNPPIDRVPMFLQHCPPAFLDVLNLIDYFISPFGGLAGAGDNLLDEFGLLRTHPSLYVDKALVL